MGTEAFNEGSRHMPLPGLSNTANLCKVRDISVGLMQFGESVSEMLDNFKNYDAEDQEPAKQEDLERDGGASNEQAIEQAVELGDMLYAHPLADRWKAEVFVVK